MDFAYNDEQKDIIKVVRDLVQKEIVPYAAEMDETGKLHEGLLEKLAAQGLLGVAIPEEFGGAGLDAITIAGVYEELAKGSRWRCYDGSCQCTGFVSGHLGRQRRSEETLF